MSKIGIIDLGSNSARLTIYEIRPDDSYLPIFEMKQNIQLAHHFNQEGKMTETGILRAISCTHLFKRAGSLHEVTEWRAVATAAIRQAKNRMEVLERIRAETNVEYVVLNGQEEGRYGYLGVINTLPLQDALLFDIGGASSEFMYVRDRQLLHVTSLPYGALNLTEMFHHVPELELGNYVYQWMNKMMASIEWLNEAHGLPLVGLGGTARALAKLDLFNKKLPMESIHGYPIEPEFIRTSFATLKTLPAAKRRKIKGLTKHRAEILVAGFATITALLERISSTNIVISRNGLREGLFFERLLKQAPTAVVPSVLDHSIRNFQHLFHVNPVVTDLFTDTALILFDTLSKAMPALHLEAHLRKLLWVTCQIESCGCAIHTEKWTKHSAYLVLSSHLNGLTYQEFQQVADLLLGKGNAALKRLSMLMRLAKLLTLQLDIAPETLICTVLSDTFQVGKVKQIQEGIAASADFDVADDFQKVFGLNLVFINS